MRARRAVLICLIVTAVVGMIVARLRHGRMSSDEVVVPPYAERHQYVGAEKCALCHREICDRQSRSRMARALSAAEEWYRQRLLPLPAEVFDSANDLRYRVTVRRGELWLEVSRGDEVASAAMDYAVGSGDRGLTFVRDTDAQAYQELRISYFADTGDWDLTPGQEDDHPASVGQALGRRIAKQSDVACLNCHSSWLVQSRGKIDRVASRFGVSCERCHGPGRAHAKAAAEGHSEEIRPAPFLQATHLANALRGGRRPESPQDEFLRSIALVRDDRLIRDLYVCGECHGRRQIWSPPGEDQLPRFQMAALVASKCYQRSLTKLRCTDCHDPHRDIQSSDRQLWTAVCLNCHSPVEQSAAGGESKRVSQADKANECPVNSASDCVSCHMPRRSPMYRMRFTHHRIGVYPE